MATARRKTTTEKGLGLRACVTFSSLPGDPDY